MVVDGLAVACVVATTGTCAPLAVAAVATTIGTSAYRNLRGANANYCGFAADVAITGATFGAGSAWGAVARSKFFVTDRADRRVLVRLGALMFWAVDNGARGVTGGLCGNGK